MKRRYKLLIYLMVIWVSSWVLVPLAYIHFKPPFEYFAGGMEALGLTIGIVGGPIWVVYPKKAG